MFWLVLAFVLAVPVVARAQAIDEKKLDAVMRDALKAFEAPGAAIVVVHNDKIVYLKGFGVRQLGKDEPVTPDTVFQIASCTKAFLAMLIAMLTGEGRIDWDDPVRRHVAYFQLSDPLADRNVTIRDLLCHRTGLSRHDILWYKAPWGPDESVRRVGKVKLTTSFRSHWEYANIPFMAAGLAASAADKRPLHESFKKRIFEPLGMAGTTARAADFPDLANHSAAHRHDDKDKVEVFPPLLIDGSGAGEICASARDLGQWLRFQLAEGAINGKRLVPLKHFREMHTPQMVVKLDERLKLMIPDHATSHLSYGLGWFIQNYKGKTMLAHGGSLPGFRTQTVLIPEAKFGVVVLTNLSGTFLPESVSRTVVDECLDLPRKDWNAHFVQGEKKLAADREQKEADKKAKRQANTKPSRELQEYAGAFDHPAYGTIKVNVVNSTGGKQLWVAWSSFDLALSHWHFDTFKVAASQPLVDDFVAFTLDGDGAVSGLRWFGQDFQKRKAGGK
jgi:CubicO group peptidase (beta-lactamase class C family)